MRKSTWILSRKLPKRLKAGVLVPAKLPGTSLPMPLTSVKLMQALKKKFGIDGSKLIRTYFHPYVYLDRKLIREKGLNQEAVERTVAVELTKAKGIALALSSTAVAAGTVPDTWLTRAVRRNFHPGRSGDVYVVWAPHWFINEFDGIRVAATHGSPWRYDTYVPIFFAGNGISSAVVHRRVTPYDVAPTLAAYLGLKPPSGSSGKVLLEVLHTTR